MNAAGVAEAIREALGGRGQVSNERAMGDQAAQFELKTTVEGMARVLDISVEERGQNPPSSRYRKRDATWSLTRPADRQRPMAPP